LFVKFANTPRTMLVLTPLPPNSPLRVCSLCGDGVGVECEGMGWSEKGWNEVKINSIFLAISGMEWNGRSMKFLTSRYGREWERMRACGKE